MGSPSLTRQAAPSQDYGLTPTTPQTPGHPHLPQPCVAESARDSCHSMGLRSRSTGEPEDPWGRGKEAGHKAEPTWHLLAPAFGTTLRGACRGTHSIPPQGFLSPTWASALICSEVISAQQTAPTSFPSPERLHPTSHQQFHAGVGCHTPPSLFPCWASTIHSDKSCRPGGTLGSPHP